MFDLKKWIAKVTTAIASLTTSISTINTTIAGIGTASARPTGTYSMASSTGWVTVPTSGLTRLSLGKGVWIVTASAQFASNSSGRRALRIYNATSSVSFGRSFVNQTATSGTVSALATMVITNISDTTSITVQLFQNSGSTLSVDLELYAVRIK